MSSIYFSRLKSNSTKSEIAGIRVLKWVQMTVYGMHCIDLNTNTLNILGTHLPYNKKLKEEKIFYNNVTDIQWVLKIWKMRKLTLNGKIIFLKQ